jgi:hypothetical protein
VRILVEHGRWPSGSIRCGEIFYRVSFPGVKRPGRGINRPPSSSARVKEKSRAIPLLPLWPLMACSRENFTFTFTFDCHCLAFHVSHAGSTTFCKELVYKIFITIRQTVWSMILDHGRTDGCDLYIRRSFLFRKGCLKRRRFKTNNFEGRAKYERLYVARLVVVTAVMMRSQASLDMTPCR